jgi:hypothetical protein
MYWPYKYYRGLTKRKSIERKRDATRRARMSWKNPRAYTPFKTDIGVKGKRSSYTQRWKKMYPKSSGLASASRITGVPKKLLKKSYDRGMAAWRTGHRPGATQQQWGYARVYSLLLCGKTHDTTDADLVRQAKKTQRARKWFAKTC